MWRPVGFVSKSLSETERNYAIHHKELLSVIRGLEEWRHILEGTKHKAEILNDHQNLTYFCTTQNLNCCQASWSLYLSCFDFELIHRPGRHSAKPDALSRWVDHKRGEVLSDGTPNEAGSIKEEVDLICTFGNHLERATFLVTRVCV